VPTALVTGATAGIGREFAVQLAARGDDVVLVARDVARLAALAQELSTRFGVAAEVIGADLSTSEGVQRVADRLRDADRPVDTLVNNAGFGIKQRFVGGDLDRELALLDVLDRAVLVLSHAAAPGMVARGRGSIITVSSVACFLAGGTYSAAKAWVTAFSRGLNAELAGTGVTATAVCPGFVRTEFHRRAGMRPSDIPGPLWLRPELVVREGLADAARGRSVSVPSVRYRVIVVVLRHLPFRLSDIASRLAARRRHRRLR